MTHQSMTDTNADLFSVPVWPCPLPKSDYMVCVCACAPPISSIKMIDGCSLTASVKTAAASFWDSPYHLSVSVLGCRLMKRNPASLAVALAISVFPQPGGPYSNTPVTVMTRVHYGQSMMNFLSSSSVSLPYFLPCVLPSSLLYYFLFFPSFLHHLPCLLLISPPAVALLINHVCCDVRGRS